MLRLNYVPSRPFIPDFSLKVCENVRILCIRRSQWLAAVRATYFENKQKPNGISIHIDSHSKPTDLFTQELQRANQDDQVNPIMPDPSMSPFIRRARAASLTSPSYTNVHVGGEPVYQDSRFRSRSASGSAPVMPLQASMISIANSSYFSHKID